MDEDYAQAAAQYALAAGPWETANWRPIIALSRVKLREGDKRQAVALAADALGRVLSVPDAPDLVEYVFVMTGSFRIAGQVGLCLPLLRAAAQSGHDEKFLRNQILQVSAEAGDLEGARQEFLADAGEDPVMRLNYAVALARDGRTAEAVAELDAMLAAAPEDSAPEKIADVYSLKGAILGSTAEAAAALEAALQRDPSHAEALNNLAWLLATAPDSTLLDPPRAVELARKTVRLRPAETPFHGTLAVALAANGEDDEAQAAMENALRLGRVNGNMNEELPDLVEKARQRARSGRE
jgi:tetratricopeptide (TPR) repeat protein